MFLFTAINATCGLQVHSVEIDRSKKSRDVWTFIISSVFFIRLNFDLKHSLKCTSKFDDQIEPIAVITVNNNRLTCYCEWPKKKKTILFHERGVNIPSLYLLMDIRPLSKAKYLADYNRRTVSKLFVNDCFQQIRKFPFGFVSVIFSPRKYKTHLNSMKHSRLIEYRSDFVHLHRLI